MNRVVKRLKSIFTLFLLILVCSAPFTASADYYITDTELGAEPISKTFTVTQVIGNFDTIQELSDPSDLFIDDQDRVYILDSGNNRIVIMDADGSNIRTIGGKYGKENLSFNDPQGIYVDSIGDIFVADTDNGRIVHLTNSGEFVEEFTQPDEDTYDTSYPFKPTKIYLDDLGTMYITNDFDYHGIILMNGLNDFLGYVGATKIGFSFTTWLVQNFATEEQKNQLSRELPAYYSNLIVQDGLIYTTSFWAESNQVKKLTPAGNNILKSRNYGEENDNETFNNQPGFVDLALDSHGNLYAADMVVGQIYVYDQDGRNLAVFGGTGRMKGEFDTIAAMDMDSHDRLYVLDSVTGIIQVFEPTTLTQNILTATALYNDGNYEEAVEPWSEVMALDSTNYLANIGLAKSEYRQGNYTEAMKLYYNSFDKEGYSDVFYDYRLQLLREYFTLICVGVVVLIFLLYFALSRAKRYADGASERAFCTSPNLGLRGYGKSILLMIFHPIDYAYGLKKNRNKIKAWHIVSLLILLSVVRLTYIYLVHFPLSDLSVQYIDQWQQLALILVPLISWIVVGFGITSISNGKQTFREMAFSTILSFTPYILLQLPLGLFSHLLASSEAGVYDLLANIILAWCVFLLLLMMKEQNEYSVGQLIAVVIKILFGILCLWMVCLLAYIVIYQAIHFFTTVFTEISIILNG